MTWLFENPLPLFLIGILTVAMLAGGWLKTGHRALIYAMGAAMLVTALLLLLEKLVVTDREQVTDTIHQIARDVERNDLPTVLSYIHPSAPQVRLEAAREFPRYDFEQVKIKQNLKIATFPKHQPPKAVAEFNVVVLLSEREGLITHHHVPRFVTVTFYKDGDQWRVYSYQHEPPQQGFLRREP